MRLRNPRSAVSPCIRREIAARSTNPCHSDNQYFFHETTHEMNSSRLSAKAGGRPYARRAILGAGLASCLAALAAHAGPAPGNRLRRLAAAIHAQAPNISIKAASTALDAYEHARLRHLTDKRLVTIVDYSPPSNERRLAVVDVRTGKVLIYTYVAQGKGSGLKYATRFSNEPGSLASSIGVYLTGHTYYGNDGYSLRLHGLDPGFNTAAYRRDIVVHSAWYVSKAFAQKYGRMGQSWGCFALSRNVERAVVKLIRGATVLVGYYPNRKWLHSSPFLTGPA